MTRIALALVLVAGIAAAAQAQFFTPPIFFPQPAVAPSNPSRGYVIRPATSVIFPSGTHVIFK